MMRRAIVMAIAVPVLACLTEARAQAQSLAPQDYIAIQQLVSK